MHRTSPPGWIGASQSVETVMSMSNVTHGEAIHELTQHERCGSQSRRNYIGHCIAVADVILCRAWMDNSFHVL